MESSQAMLPQVVSRGGRARRVFIKCLGCSLALSACATTARAQVVVAAPAAAAEEANPNDPKLPFHLPSQSSEVKEALADFHRYAKKATWERAFKALEKVQAGPPNALTPRDDGLLM